LAEQIAHHIDEQAFIALGRPDRCLRCRKVLEAGPMGATKVCCTSAGYLSAVKPLPSDNLIVPRETSVEGKAYRVYRNYFRHL
jgi:hypothetical protein